MWPRTWMCEAWWRARSLGEERWRKWEINALKGLSRHWQCTHRHTQLLQKFWGACNWSMLSVFSPDALQWVFMKKGAFPEGDYWYSPGKKAARGKTATTQTVSMAESRPQLQKQGQVQSSGWWFGEWSFWGEKSEKISEAWEVWRLSTRHVEGKHPGLLALIWHKQETKARWV